MCHTEVYDFMKVCTERGLGYNIFRDVRFTRFLRRNMTRELAMEIVKAASAHNLKYMGKLLRDSGSLVSIVFDLGTIDRIHTLNVLVVSSNLGKAFVLSSLPVEDSTGAGIADLITKKVLQPLFTVSRILEADRSTAPMALRSYLYFVNDASDNARQYFVLNRCLKFVAVCDVFVAEAALTGMVLPTMGKMAHLGSFRNALTNILLPMVKAIAKDQTELEAAEVVDAWKHFVEGTPKAHSHFRCAPLTRNLHYLEAPPIFLPLKLLHEKLGHIIASETAAERSLSLQKTIRSERFCLNPARCEMELVLAFNPLPVEDIATSPRPTRPAGREDDSMKSFPSESDTDEEDNRERAAKRHRAEGMSSVNHESARTLEHLVATLTTGPLTPLPVDYGVQMLMMWHWRTVHWDKLSAGRAVKWKSDPSSLAKTLSVVKYINKKTGVLKLRSGNSGEKVYSMGMAAAFIHCVQLDGSTFDWPAHAIVIDTAPFVEERVSADVEPEYGLLDDMDGFERLADEKAENDFDDSGSSSSNESDKSSAHETEADTDVDSDDADDHDNTNLWGEDEGNIEEDSV